MTTNSSRCYRFGRFELQPQERRLLLAGTAVRVGQHAFDLLLVLVERSGHLVSKDDLLARVWSKLVVTENTLQVHVSALRKILGPDAVATVSGRGYRFTLEVTRLEPPSATAIDAPNHNLPQQLTSFIGRDKEVLELTALLATTRLLTLTGSGGCGKTRLAMQLASGQMGAYEGGLWMVELAPLTDPGLVPQIVAGVLGVEERVGRSLTETLGEFVGSKRLLLLLDNAEHVLGGCAELVDALLRCCGGLIILVTSRERLGIGGELTYRVPSLSVPDPVRDTTQEQITACESARLFIERARLQRPHLAITAQNARALASICQRLDGVPLAIELAAPRTRSMSLEEVSRRLDQRFGLLTGGSRTSLPRHQTLRASIDWSHDLLSDMEKALLRRLSVFAGGCTLDTAERVCAWERIDVPEVLDLLTSLADKSLLVADEQDGTTRYGLLETVRHYARDQLRQSDDESETERRHLVCFSHFAEEVKRQADAGDVRTATRRLDAESDNVRAALSRAVRPNGDVAEGLRLAIAIRWFLDRRSYYTEGAAWFSSLLAAAPKDIDKETKAKALRGAGSYAMRRGDFAAARVLREEALGLWQELGNDEGVIQSLLGLGQIAATRGDHEGARAMFTDALEIARPEHATQMRSALVHLALVAGELGQYDVAHRHLAEGLTISQSLGPRYMALTLYNIGMMAYYQGDYATARARMEESLPLRREGHDEPGMAGDLTGLGLVAHALGDDQAALAMLREAQTLKFKGGDPRSIALALEALAPVACAVAGPVQAARVWGGLERLREKFDVPMAPVDRRRYERELTDARASLANDGLFDRAWQEGRDMSFEQVLQHATAIASGLDGSQGDPK